MAERLVTIPLREYEALRDLSDQFDIIRETSEYERVRKLDKIGDTVIMNIEQDDLNRLFNNLLNVDEVVTKINDKEKNNYGNKN